MKSNLPMHRNHAVSNKVVLPQQYVGAYGISWGDRKGDIERQGRCNLGLRVELNTWLSGWLMGKERFPHK